MAYVITQRCVNDTSRIAECPVDATHSEDELVSSLGPIGRSNAGSPSGPSS